MARAGRRGNREGSITRYADGRWVARVSLEDGGRRAFYARTREEAARKLVVALRAQEDGAPIPSGRLTLGQFTADWLVGVRATLRPSTWSTYERYLRLHVMPRLGRVVLGRLQAVHLQRLYGELIEDGLSPSSVRHVHAILHRLLGQAMRWDAVARNVADLVDPPRAARFEMTALTAAQVRRLLAAARDDRLEALYVLAVSTGMRRGELLALRWKDVSLERGRLAVTATQQREGGLALAEPKTPRSRRSIEIGRVAVEALQRRRAAQAQERLLAGEEWTDTGLVFSTTTGTFIEPGNLIRRSFEPLLKRARLPRIRFHDLRHTAATLMLAEGVHPKVASEVLGHSTIAVTLDLYSHVTRSMGRQTAQLMDELLTEGE